MTLAKNELSDIDQETFSSRNQLHQLKLNLNNTMNSPQGLSLAA